MQHPQDLLNIKLIFCLSLFLLSSCAYTLGYSDRQLPEGHEAVAIPVFENKTEFTGIETYFTNSLRRQFSKSKVARVVNQNQAPAIIKGKVTRVLVNHVGSIDANDAKEVYDAGTDESDELPSNTVLTTDYRVSVFVELKIVSQKTGKQIWSGNFQGAAPYTAPQARSPRLNSANALYNANARMNTIAEISKDIMAEAHDRMSENF